MKNDGSISSKELQNELNKERRRKGLKDLPAINTRASTGTYARMDKSFSSALNFFIKMWKKN